MKKFAEEVFYAVSLEKEIVSIVSSAINKF
jgi:hypothetical protein